jgi:hypothetical protein
MALALGCGFIPAAEDPAAEAVAADERFLRDAGVGTDGAALLAFFRARTLSPADLGQVEVWVRQLGDERFARREEASRQLARRGPSVRPFLRAALRDPDREVARRAAACLEEIDAGPGVSVTAAAARLLVRRDPPGATAALLAYLPFADDEELVLDVMDALRIRGTVAAATEPALAAALKDPQPLRRGAAAYVLGRCRDPRVQDRVRPLLADREARVRFLAARGLLAGRNRAAVPVLIALLTEAPEEETWRVEDCLIHVAAGQAPSVPEAGKDDPRKVLRAAWEKWWANNAGRVDLARLDDAPRLLGLTLVPEMHANKVWECGADGKPLWEVTGLECPIDAQVLPGGRLLVAELNGNRVTERDHKGTVLWQRQVNTPIACQRLPSGHTFIGTNSRVFVVARDGKEVSSYTPEPGFFIHSVQRLANGHVVCVSMEGVVREVDAAGREVCSVTLPRRGGWSGVEAAPGNRYLVVNNNSGEVFEIDRSGKTVWSHKLPGACYASRLPNGRTLIVSNSSGIVEVDPTGKTVWSRGVATSLWRAHRR